MSQTRRDLLRHAAAGLFGISVASGVRDAFAQSTPVASPVTADGPLLVSASDAMETYPPLDWLAVSDVEVFMEGAIGGASLVKWEEMALTESADESIALWEDEMRALLSARGVPFDRAVTVYDDGSLFAARGWWQLAYLGHPEMSVLDGGSAAWTGAGGELSSMVGLAPIETPMSDPAAIRRGMLATKDEVLASLGDDGVFIVDARSSGEYADGHIPGAVNAPYTGNAQNGLYLAADVLQERYADLGMADGKRAITYCSTGARGSVAAFSLRLAGFTDVALYVPSWGEWSADPDAPVE